VFPTPISYKTSEFGRLRHIWGFIANFLLRMRETAMFPLPIWGRFQLIFLLEKEIVRHIFTFSVYLAYCPRNTFCETWYLPHSHPRWSFAPSLKLRRLSIAELQHLTWPVRRGKFFPNIWNPWPDLYIHYATPYPQGSTIKVNWVICQNSVRPCVKGKFDVCACARSRDL